MEEDVHVMPIDDLVEHEPTIDCWCRPVRFVTPVGPDVIVHNALDARELIEMHGIN